MSSLLLPIVDFMLAFKLYCVGISFCAVGVLTTIWAGVSGRGVSISTSPLEDSIFISFLRLKAACSWGSKSHWTYAVTEDGLCTVKGVGGLFSVSCFLTAITGACLSLVEGRVTLNFWRLSDGMNWLWKVLKRPCSISISCWRIRFRSSYWDDFERRGVGALHSWRCV